MSDPLDLEVWWKSLTAKQKREFAAGINCNVHGVAQACTGTRKPSDRFITMMKLKLNVEEVVLPPLKGKSAAVHLD